MATQQDLQELIRLFTVTRKMPPMQAMGLVRDLQAVNLKSIKDIAEADLPAVQTAIKDEKTARSVQSACKTMLKRASAGNKRDAPTSPSGASSSKRSKLSSSDTSSHDHLSPQELEASLELPVNLDEDLISRTTLQTNRAPLVLAFAVELLRYTMPEQPPSSRLSLAQAVVSANSRSKAISLGIEKGSAADDESWAVGQPKVKILGREVAVLKRGGYEWKGEEKIGTDADDTPAAPDNQPDTDSHNNPPPTHPFFQPKSTSQPTWSTSQPLSLKDSTFIARATHLSSPSARQSLLTALFASAPQLKTATHNAWAYRTTDPSRPDSVAESSHDDGETGAGPLLLRVMREAGATDTLVVLSRWFGGTMLGPDRWRLMRNCVAAALGERLRRDGAEVVVGAEAVWGIDGEGARKGGSPAVGRSSSVVGMPIHSPQGARAYLLKSFGSAPGSEEDGEKQKKKVAKRTQREIDAEKEGNLALLLGALRLMFDSWADHLTPAELDRRAWSWYVAVRPEVDVGPSGWGAKGLLRLEDILKLRRKENA